MNLHILPSLGSAKRRPARVSTVLLDDKDCSSESNSSILQTCLLPAAAAADECVEGEVSKKLKNLDRARRRAPPTKKGGLVKTARLTAACKEQQQQQRERGKSTGFEGEGGEDTTGILL